MACNTLLFVSQLLQKCFKRKFLHIFADVQSLQKCFCVDSFWPFGRITHANVRDVFFAPPGIWRDKTACTKRQKCDAARVRFSVFVCVHVCIFLCICLCVSVADLAMRGVRLWGSKLCQCLFIFCTAKTRNLMLPDAASGTPECSKTRFRLWLCPGNRWVSSLHCSISLASWIKDA